MNEGHTAKLPSALQKQQEEANAALDALDKMRSEETEAIAEAAKESAAETAANTRDAFSETKPEATPASGPTQVERKGGEDTVAAGEFEKLKHQLDVLQGKYNSEMPRFAAKVRELTDQNDSLKDELDEAREAVRTAEVDAEAYKKYLSAEEQEDLENTFAEFNSRIARGVTEDIVEKRTKGVDKRMDELQKKIDELNAAQTAAQNSRFWEEADRLAPGLKSANELNEPGWVAFLDQTEPMSHFTYRDIGVSAVGRGDFEAVANLYSLYKDTTKAPEAAPRRTAESQVKPESRSSAPSTQSKPKGRLIPQSEIEKFFNAAARSGLSEVEIAKKEAEFDQAAEEGRIIFGR